MCGIGGVVLPKGQEVSAETLDRLAAALAHRGPDGEGRFARGNVGLVHRRLSIIDVEGGAQPLSEPGGAVLAANGEIYNYVELRSELKVNFVTRSDCEPPLYLYRQHGLDYVRQLRGMYAIALYDGQRLAISRDPFGIKPLYYAERDGTFAFASETAALVKAGMAARAIEPTALAELLQLQFTTGARTIFPSVRRVLPGETLAIEDGRITETRRQPALAPDGPPPANLDAALAQFDKVMTDSVTVHQRSDVPYGLFLSGGIDSAVVLAFMGRTSPHRVRAFTAGFTDSRAADERQAARALAHSVGAAHVEIEFSEQDFWALLPRVAAAMDDPAADYAILPTYKLAREAAKELKVVLSGEGGDELFAGYGRYRRAMRPWWLGGRTMRTKGAFDGLGILRVNVSGWRDGVAETEFHEAGRWRSRLQAAQAVDCADWLPHDLLAKLDRCLMAHGVEGRTPFLDPVVAQFACSLPDDLKVRGQMGKWLLRTWLDRNCPAARAFAGKQGFTVPVGEWIARQGRRLGPLVARQEGVAAICDATALERLFRSSDRRAGFAAWVLLFYALWHRRHIQGRMPHGDVFDCLAARA